jgi:hypothetical protein
VPSNVTSVQPPALPADLASWMSTYAPDGTPTVVAIGGAGLATYAAFRATPAASLVTFRPGGGQSQPPLAVPGTFLFSAMFPNDG